MKMKHTRREFVRILFVASQAAVAARFLPADLLAESTPAGGLNFLVFGDWGRKGERDQVEVATQMAKAAGETDAKFVISVGDNFYDNGVTSTEDELWRLSFEQVYKAPSLQVPWHSILGNHDYHGNCDAQIEYAKTSSRWRMPARYYLQTHAIAPGVTADFFYLDTTPMVKGYYKDKRTHDHVSSQDVPQQIAWFKAALTESKAQWKIVFAHHPIYSGGGHGDTPELIESILPLLHEYKVQAYFNGHDHDLQHLMAGEVNLFDSGAGSSFNPTRKTSHTKFAAASSGFTAVSLQADKMAVRMIDNDGKLLYATTVSRALA
jgi:tartrate-resistant acid phosphatase type 5